MLSQLSSTKSTCSKWIGEFDDRINGVCASDVGINGSGESAGMVDRPDESTIGIDGFGAASGLGSPKWVRSRTCSLVE